MNFSNGKIFTQNAALARAVYFFANYEDISEEYGKIGCVIDGTKNFYSDVILNIIAENCKGFSEKEILAMIEGKSNSAKTCFHDVSEVTAAINKEFNDEVVDVDEVEQSRVLNVRSTDSLNCIEYAIRISEYFVVVRDTGILNPLYLETY